MAKVSRLSLGHNPNKAVDNLRRSLEMELSKAPRSQLNTLGNLHNLMVSLVKIANSISDAPGSTLGLSTLYRRSQSADTFLKNMLDQKMNKTQKGFKQRLEQMRERLPINSSRLAVTLQEMKETSLEQVYSDLWTLDKEAAHIFASNQRKRLSKALDLLIVEFTELNLELASKEIQILTSSFLQKITPKRIHSLEEIDPEMFLCMKTFFNEFLNYFDEQVKDKACCNLTLQRQPVYSASAPCNP